MKYFNYALFLLVFVNLSCERHKKNIYDAQEKDIVGHEVVISEFLKEYKKVKLEFVQINLKLPKELKEMDPTSRENFTEEYKKIRKKFQSLVEISDGGNNVLLNDLKECDKIIGELRTVR